MISYCQSLRLERSGRKQSYGCREIASYRRNDYFVIVSHCDWNGVEGSNLIGGARLLPIVAMTIFDRILYHKLG